MDRGKLQFYSFKLQAEPFFKFFFSFSVGAWKHRMAGGHLGAVGRLLRLRHRGVLRPPL